jgi:hypothetical protein
MSNENHTEGTRQLASSTRRIPFGPGVARMRWMAVSDLLPLGSECHQLANQPIIYRQYAVLKIFRLSSYLK